MRIVIARLSCACLVILAAGSGLRAEEDAFDASAHLGIVIDSFAANDLQTYLNSGESGEIRERAFAGFEFDYRFAGSREPGKRSWHVFGSTTHGVRSADVNCAENSDTEICKTLGFDPDNPGEQVLAIIREATSLEAYGGIRYEFKTLQKKRKDRARLYFRAQYGFLTVEGDDDDLLDDHDVGFGLVKTNGRFADSYVEVAYGGNDVFEANPDDRYKIDGLLIWSLTRGNKVRLFAQMFVDSDFDDGADSVQSYLGFDVDLSLFGP